MSDLSGAGKILSIDELAEQVRQFKAEGKKIVLCHGVFDLLHIGHIRYFRQARKYGDVLVVTVTPDRYVDKGPDRPAFSEHLRTEAIASLGVVDLVAVNGWPTAEETLRLLRPAYYVKGAEFKDLADMTGKIGQEAAVVKEIGAELVFAEDIVFSSSNLINRYMSQFSNETNEYLKIFRNRYQRDDILQIIDRMASLNVLVIGDTILDEYHYCSVLGVSSKDPALALKYHSHDLFAGGALAVANHVAAFAGNVQLVTVLGEQDRQEDFIRSQLSPNITPYFITQPKSFTTLKRRFVDGYSFNKLLEIYVMNSGGLPDDEDERLCQWMRSNMSKYDLVVSADFGHGAISGKLAREMAADAPYLAVNTQANAGNRGYHVVTRYPRADFVSLAVHELQLAMRNELGHERTMTDTLARRLGCNHLVTTLGRRGCLVWGKSEDLLGIPALARKVVDRIGAGDAFFAIASLASRLDVSNEILGFLGNVVGAEAVEIIGNKKPIEKMKVKKHITAILR
ncbi:MAG: adenylyltransferase/cytidyltransferase family protein [Proteobacteria bacterium]|nr:adenylyltransferase/cytidyltransferase family protein [Pseudomonadota bacterium]MBU4296645.1 adenylyltransferase/cytidyltransferase family protein [Pseudomonadota bacterium]MCG2748438.1 PfkB family carbohydrate kinase [Desulfobulbaceae bacterium]